MDSIRRGEALNRIAGRYHGVAVRKDQADAIELASRREPAWLAFAALPIPAVDVGRVKHCYLNPPDLWGGVCNVKR